MSKITDARRTLHFSLHDVNEVILASHSISNGIRHYYSQMGIVWSKKKKRLKKKLR